jgi:hypothetical protein
MNMRKATPVRHLPDEAGSLEAEVSRLAEEGQLAGAARVAVERQTAKGFAITFLRGDAIVKRFPNGREQILGKLAHRTGGQAKAADVGAS